MIEYHDSLSMYNFSKKLIKRDFFYSWIKKNKINPKNHEFIFIDDKLTLIKLSNELKKKGIKTTSYLRKTRFNEEIKKEYDYKLNNLDELIKIIEKKKNKKELIIFSDFDNTLSESGSELGKDKMREKNFFEKNENKWWIKIVSLIVGIFSKFEIIIDLIKPTNKEFKYTKKFHDYLIKNNIKTIVVSYRTIALQKKYFK